LNTAPSSTLFWTDTLRCVEYILNGKIPAGAVQLYDSKTGRKSDREFVGVGIDGHTLKRGFVIQTRELRLD
jgi:hypothetical protein